MVVSDAQTTRDHCSRNLSLVVATHVVTSRKSLLSCVAKAAEGPGGDFTPAWRPRWPTGSRGAAAPTKTRSPTAGAPPFPCPPPPAPPRRAPPPRPRGATLAEGRGEEGGAVQGAGGIFFFCASSRTGGSSEASSSRPETSRPKRPQPLNPRAHPALPPGRRPPRPGGGGRLPGRVRPRRPLLLLLLLWYTLAATSHRRRRRCCRCSRRRAGRGGPPRPAGPWSALPEGGG